MGRRAVAAVEALAAAKKALGVAEEIIKAHAMGAA
jgi:hypothetical protein